MSNQHISQFLDYYIKLPNPQYAVLLKGKWGSGKTHFINEYKEHLKTNEQKFIYVSLYGVTSYDEIETKFLETIHPRLYNKKTIFAGKIAKQFLKGTLKIDWDGNGQENAELETKIPDFKPEDLLNTKDYILIFDDLERCSINIINLLGYINHFVEHQSYKVILIANEEELIKNEKELEKIANEEELIKNEKELEKTEKYTLIKEKLIGKTFEFKTDANLAYDSFLTELKNTNNVKEDVLEKEKSNILELFEKSESKNLRALRQTLLDFERFYDEVLIAHSEKERLMIDILHWFFLFSFEIRQGNSDILDLQKLSEEYYSYISVQNADKAGRTKYHYFYNKYKFKDNYFDIVISFDLWKEVLLNSHIQKEEIDLSLRNSKYYFDENTPSWQKLTNWYNLGDDEFEKLLQDVYEKFSNNEYKNYKHFKLVASMLLSFQELNLLRINFEKLFILIKDNFNSLYEEDFIINKDILFSKNKLMEDRSYKNTPYIESSSFQKLLEYIDDFANKKKSIIFKNESEQIIKAIKEQNHNKLFELLEGKNDIRIIDYKDKSILSYINADDLFQALMKTNGTTMYCFGGIIKDRYNYRTKELLCEETFLRELLRKIDNYLEKNQVKVSTYNLKKEVESNIIIALERIENNKEIIKQTSNV